MASNIYDIHSWHCSYNLQHLAHFINDLSFN